MSHLTLFYSTGSELERLLKPTDRGGIVVADLQALRLVCTMLGCSGPCYALFYPFSSEACYPEKEIY